MNRITILIALCVATFWCHQPIADDHAVPNPDQLSHWSLQPITSPPVPTVKQTQWIQSPIDVFILEKLESKGILPARRVNLRTLIRRVTYDLTGLPATPDEVSAFLNDSSLNAFARVVDRLLESPAYGERWGRHWLDVARYSDSNGLDENIAHGNAWRYRDYVIRAFNSNKPFDLFIHEQLAGDLIKRSDQDYERIIATGYLSLGPKVLAEVDEGKMEMDIVDEQIDTVGRTFLGLTLGCARCHDHKFDPISTKDYYALAGIFKSTRTMEHFKKIARWNEVPVPDAEQQLKVDAYRGTVAAAKTKIEQIVADATKSLERAGTAPPIKEASFPEAVKKKLTEMRADLKKIEAAPVEPPTAMAVSEGSVQDVKVHIRGDHCNLADEVPRRFPTALTSSSHPSIPKSASGRDSLAQWLTDRGNPLTARVLVNRLWHWHFGQGLVSTPNNFGVLGEKPTHPELLDWLASQLMNNNWSIKKLHRIILLSSAWQMSCEISDQAAELDPANRLVSRMNVRRLEAEALRDSMLSVSGLLERSMGGSMLHVDNRKFLFDHTSKDTTNYSSFRRAVYLPVIRNHLYDFFQLFDYNDASVSNGNRTSTVVASQALFLMNSELSDHVAMSFAGRLLEINGSDAERITMAYELALGRPASYDEIDKALMFLTKCKDLLSDSALPDGSRSFTTDQIAWKLFCQTVVSTNEFVYVR